MRRRPRTDWYALRSAVEEALRRRASFPPSTRIAGRVRVLDAGLNHENFAFGVEADEPLPPCAEGFILRRLLHHPGDDEGSLDRLRTEVETLQALESLPHDFDTPRFACFVPEPAGVTRAFIESAVTGVPLSLLTNSADGRCAAIDAIAQVAAGVHRLPVASFPFLPGHADAAAHLASELEALDDGLLRAEPEAGAAMEWIGARRSNNRPAVLLHGDLMPQNVLMGLGTERLGVVDWEYAKRGDPAYDFAIVTCGSRKPLGVSGGLSRLVAAYRAAGGAAIEPADVAVWEALLALRWLRDAIRDTSERRHDGQGPEFYRNQLRAILRRVPR